MKILMIANTLPPDDLSGAGEQVLQLAWGLEQRGHEVRVLGRGASSVRGPKLLFPLTVLLPALRQVRAFRPDVVQVHESDCGLIVPLLRLFRQRSKRPTLVALLQVSYRREMSAVRAVIDRDDGKRLARPTAGELRFRDLRGPLQLILGKMTARGCDLVLAPSRQTADELESDYAASSVRVLPNCTGAPSVGAGEEASASKISVVTSGGASPLSSWVSSGYLLFVGRLRIRKGVEVLLRALERLSAEGSVPHLLIAGDGERNQLLQDRCRDLGLTGGVTFLGRCSAKQVRSLLSSAYALVVPSIYEGMPLVILEAMEASLPVVASGVSGIPEVVLDGETGWVVEPEDSVELARALAEVIGNSEAAGARGRAGRVRLENHFRPLRVADRWLELVTASCEANAEKPAGKRAQEDSA